MSEIGSPQPEIPAEMAEKEAEGIKIATEIADLRASARTEADYQSILQKTRALKEIFGIGIEGRLSGEITEQMEKAKDIIGESNFVGPAEIKTAFGFEPELSSVPEIPFSEMEIGQAKELGQMLILRTDKGGDGSPLTIAHIKDIIGDKLKDDGKSFYSNDWYKDEEFSTSETAKAGWALVSREEIPDSTNKNYLEQTEVVVDYLRSSVFSEKSLPSEYQKAIGEFESQKDEITDLLESDWKAASERISKLSLTSLTRQTPIEAVYDLIAHYQNTEEKLLPNRYTWTSARDSGGGLVSVGGFDAGGLHVDGDHPDDRYDGLGVSFSRSQ